MKFFHRKHSHQSSETQDKEFWDKTEFSAHAAPSYDTVDRIRPDGYANFLMDLNTFTTANSGYFSNFRRSIVDPNLIVSENNWVLWLVRKKDHAVIALETYREGEGLCLRWFDFLPKNKPNPRFEELNRKCFGMLTNFQALENKAVPGMVRYCPTNGGLPLINIPPTMSKSELFSKLNWNEDCDSWRCMPSQAMAMLSSIKNDFELSRNGNLEFKFCGHTIPNCTTWTWDKLQEAGINAENHNFQNRFIIRASKNIGTKRHHYMQP